MNLPQANRAASISQMIGGSPNVGTQQAALAANPDLPIIRGTAELVQQVGGEIGQGIDQVHQQEAVSDEIAGRVEFSRYLQEAEHEMKTIPTSGVAAIGHKKRTEEIYKRADQRFEAWQSGNAPSGLRNVRHDSAKKNLKFFKQQAVAQSQLKIADYTFNKQRQETEERFDLGFLEAARVADDTAEESIAFIGQGMRNTGVDPAVVADKERTALAGVSNTRFDRARLEIEANVETYGPQWGDAKVSELEAALKEKDGPFRHLDADKRLELEVQLKEMKGYIPRDAAERSEQMAKQSNEILSRFSTDFEDEIAEMENSEAGGFITEKDVRQRYRDKRDEMEAAGIPVDSDHYDKLRDEALVVHKARIGEFDAKRALVKESEKQDTIIMLTEKATQPFKTGEIRSLANKALKNGDIDIKTYQEFDKIDRAGFVDPETTELFERHKEYLRIQQEAGKLYGVKSGGVFSNQFKATEMDLFHLKNALDDFKQKNPTASPTDVQMFMDELWYKPTVKLEQATLEERMQSILFGVDVSKDEKDVNRQLEQDYMLQSDANNRSIDESF
jgi:hypothetical protein